MEAQRHLELGDTTSGQGFVRQVEKYGLWPITVWPLSGRRGPVEKALHEGETREDAGTYGFQDGASSFSYGLACTILKMFAHKPGSLVFDPFGGGAIRAAAAAACGHVYLGVELRQAQVVATKAALEKAGDEIGGKVEIICGDSCDAGIVGRTVSPASADFCITCPPYWNLEIYGGGANDLSACSTYAGFLDKLRGAIENTRRVLRPGATSVWVVGLLRDSVGGLLPMNHDVARLHRAAGFVFDEEIVVYWKDLPGVTRVGQFEKGNHRLVRVHEYVLVFRGPV